MSRDPNEARPNPDLDAPSTWVPAIWTAGFAVGSNLARQWNELLAATSSEPDWIAHDPSLDNDALIAQMLASVALQGL